MTKLKDGKLAVGYHRQIVLNMWMRINKPSFRSKSFWIVSFKFLKFSSYSNLFNGRIAFNILKQQVFPILDIWWPTCARLNVIYDPV